MANAPVACTPQDIQEAIPCFHCLSERQLRMVFMWLWAVLEGYDFPGDLDQLLEDSKCFTCLSEKQILEQKVALFAEFLGENDLLGTGDEAGAIEQMKCFQCLTPRQVEAAILYLICEFLTQMFQV